MQTYTHGGDIYHLPQPVLDFSANQSPLGMPPAVADAARAAVAEADHYPDSLCRDLRTAIGRLDGVPPEQICCGNGAADVLFRLAAALRPKQALITAPAFSEYEDAVRVAGGTVQRHRLDPANDFDVDRTILRDLVPPVDLLILCTPNNPTGRLIGEPLLREILNRCREAAIRPVIDECFLRLSDGSGVGLAPWLEEFPELVLLRAFTKSHAMPGLRLGYCLTADPALPNTLYRAGQPWSVSAVAQAAGIAACGCPEWPERTMELVRSERDRLTAVIRSLGGIVWESAANYLLFRVPGRTDLKERLLEHGILIRSCANYHGLGPDYYRTAVRRPEENDRLLTAMEEVLS